MKEAISRLKKICDDAGGLFIRNAKIKFYIKELGGTLAIKLTTRQFVKCQIYFGHGVPNSLVDNIFNVLPQIDQLKTLELVNIAYIPLNIGKIKGLKNLIIESKNIEIPPCEISNIKSLEALTLRLEKMEVFPEWILMLENLQRLDLVGAGIKEIPLNIDQLKRLKVLDLCQTNLEKIPYTILNLNLGFKNFFNETNEKGIYICDATCEFPPINVISGESRRLLKQYYNNNCLVPQSEVRVILLGMKGSGKTSIVQRFQEITYGGNYYMNGGWTEGISINDINHGDSEVLHMWDFGGQEIMLSTHTLFLRDHCIYIIVLNARQGDEPDKWLDYIGKYGRNSIVYIVNNHMDEADNYRPDINKMRRIYPNLIGENNKIWEISCEKPEEYPLNELYEQICEGAKTYLKREIPLSWNQLSLKLSDMKQNGKKVNYISHEIYIKECEECGIKEKDEMVNVLNWLNEIGVVFTYGNPAAIESINEFKVLRPAWVTDAIYKIINNVKGKGDKCIIKHDEIRDALTSGKSVNATGNSYKDLEINFILDVMRKFGLSFCVSETNEFIPAVAQNEEFKEVFEWTENQEDTSLDMIYQISSERLQKYQENNVNVTQFYQTVIKIVEEFEIFPRMWRTGALFSNINGLNILLFLQNNGKWNNEMRLIIKSNPLDREKSAECQWKIQEYLKSIAVGFKVDAKILVQSEEGEHYYSIDDALRYILNKDFDYYDTALDAYIDLYEDIIIKVFPNKSYYLKETLEKLHKMVHNGEKQTNEALNSLRLLIKMQEEIYEICGNICDNLNIQNEYLSHLFVQKVNESEELWEFCSQIKENSVTQAEELQKLQEHIKELSEKRPGESGYKKVISSCINAIVTFVTLSTADYSKAVDLFKKLVPILMSIADQLKNIIV